MEMGEASQLAPFSGALHELGHSRAERLNLLVENAAGRVRGQQHQSVGHPRADPGGIGPMHRSARGVELRSEEHTSELQSLMRISYDVFCLKKKNASD